MSDMITNSGGTCKLIKQERDTCRHHHNRCLRSTRSSGQCASFTPSQMKVSRPTIALIALVLVQTASIASNSRPPPLPSLPSTSRPIRDNKAPLEHRTKDGGSQIGLDINGEANIEQESSDKTIPTAVNSGDGSDGQPNSEKAEFAVELLKMLHEQYGSSSAMKTGVDDDKLEERRSAASGLNLLYGRGVPTIEQTAKTAGGAYELLEALGVEGDTRRLIDWVRHSFNPASIPELTTQFVVSKLGSVNCPAILKPDREESLVPRFLLFNEHYVDLPYELSINPRADECLLYGKLDPARKTIVLIHGFLAGYTTVDGLTNIKNRLLDLNKFAKENAIETFIRASESNNGSYVFTENIEAKIRSQQYNVIIVDWYNGANPVPRANYIKAAVNAQVVGRLIARFLSALVAKCGTPAGNMHIIAHSLGCHVSGFTGKAMNEAGHRLGKITHLDPVGLCFGRLFSKPKYRLSPNDALDTHAVHVSLNIFDNPLDGAHSNFMVNGGRDQVGCDGQGELKNSTTSSVALLYDQAARFGPCSHMRALALFEDDHSSKPEQCQFVGYRCANYDRFLAGKCGHCDAANSQCRLMSLAPLNMQFRTESLGVSRDEPIVERRNYTTHVWAPFSLDKDNKHRGRSGSDQPFSYGAKSSRLNSTTDAGYDMIGEDDDDDDSVGEHYYLKRRSDRRLLSGDKRERLAQVLEKLRSETRSALAGSLTSLVRDAAVSSVSAALNPAAQSNKEAGGGDDDDEGGVGGSEQIEEENMTTVSTSTITTMTTTTTTTTTTQKPPTTSTIDLKLQETTVGKQQRDAGRMNVIAQLSQLVDSGESRQHSELVDKAPLGSQAIPAGSLNGPQYYLGTGAVSPYCVNYYQFRVLIAESRLQRAIQLNALAPNRLAPQYGQQGNYLFRAAASLPKRRAHASGRDMLHLTVKLTDTFGHFFKGFSLLEHARSLGRVMNDFVAPHPLLASFVGAGGVAGPNEPMVELTMLLNTTRAQPIKIGETILSYYFHPILLADRVEVNYMSNISPDIRAKYSSALCPVAINDRHQLVKYVECHKV